MLFPETDRFVFRQNPLAEVVCQLRFPPVLTIAAELPSAFQEMVRDSYPLYERAEPTLAVQGELAPILSRLQLQVPNEAITHRFITEDRGRSISLAHDFVAVVETVYKRWENFRPEIERACIAAKQVYKPAFFSRVGLRYQNIINRSKLGLEGESWAKLLRPPVLGLLGTEDLGDHISEARTETLVKVDEVAGGFVRIRQGLIKAQSDPEELYLVDADFFTQEKCTDEQAFNALDVFHHIARNLFRWAITPRLEAVLDPQPIE